MAAVYVYFLIFAQFGFLQALAAAGRPAALLQPILALMGAAGVGGSALVAWGYTEAHGRTWLGGAFVVAGLAAALAMEADTTGMFLAVAGLTGLGMGGATVSLAAQIRRVVGSRRLGLTLGAGTGLAYGFCNLPAVFQAGPAWQALIAQGAAAAGLLAVAGLEPRAPAPEKTGADYRARGLGAWVVAFLALVWLDSAAFYVIQHNPDLQGGTWRAPAQLYANASLHLVTALLAGWALDRGRASSVRALPTCRFQASKSNKGKKNAPWWAATNRSGPRCRAACSSLQARTLRRTSGSRSRSLGLRWCRLCLSTHQP